MEHKTGTKEKMHLHIKSVFFYCRLPVVKNDCFTKSNYHVKMTSAAPSDGCP